MKFNNQSGFAAIETVLIAVIIIIVAGLGIWVSQKNRANNAKSTVKEELKVAEIGTAASIEEVNQQDIDEELNAEETLATQEQKDAQSDSTALSGIGDGYEVVF